MVAFASFALLAFTDVRPQPDRAIIADTEAYVQKVFRDWKTPGLAVCIVKNDRILWQKCLGVRRAGSPDPITPDTVFQIGSLSKSFTATALSRMVDAGKISFDDRASDLVPEFQMPEPYATQQMKLWDLMAQHSGLPPYAGDGYALVNPTRDQIIHAIRYLKPVAGFREGFQYVNNLWLVAAKAGENRYGKPWEEYLPEQVFEPLGMTQTSVGLRALYSASNFATPHAAPDVPIAESDPSSSFVYLYGPAGGVNSTLRDMARYAAMHLNEGQHEGKPYLRLKTAELIHSPRTPVLSDLLPSTGKLPVTTAYCQGFVAQYFTPTPLIWHNGGTPGIRSIMGLIPEADLAIVVLSNLGGGSQVPEAIMYRFYDAVYGRPKVDYSARYLAKPKPPVPVRPAHPAPTRPLDQYAGAFENVVFGRFEFRAEGDVLTVAVPNSGGAVLRLSPWDGDQFRWTTSGTVAGDDGFATFSFAPDGKVSTVVLQNLADDFDGGRFKRVEE